MREDYKCKICRRLGEKLFLKGEKCLSPKCPLLRKPYPPGNLPKRRKSITLSEYGKMLREKQKLKRMYLLKERHFSKIAKEVLEKKGKEDVSKLFIKRLEMKLFNVIFRIGFAKSRDQAKQLVSHGHFLLNGKRTNIPTIELKVGDEIHLRKSSQKNIYFQQILPTIKKEEIPDWLSLNEKDWKIKVIKEPDPEKIALKVDVPLALSFYSK